MFQLLMIMVARGGAALEGTVLVGGRAAPESAIPLPGAFETTIEPSGLGAAIVEGRLGRSEGVWANATLAAWVYAPETEATSVAGGPAVGWTGASDAPVHVDVAGRYDLQSYPNLSASSSRRGEALVRGMHRWDRWSVSALVLGIDRRFAGATVADFTTAELGVVAAFRPSGAVAVEIGGGAQTNQAGGAGSDGPVGAQARSLVRLRVSRTDWSAALEHRLIVAAEGEFETDTQPLFTPLGDYSDDVDALSGGGFVQNRVDLSAAWAHGPWSATAGAIARLRQADAEELRVAYGRALEGRVEGRRKLTDQIDGFASVGVAGATLSGGGGYTDAWGWVGVSWRGTARER